jgi:hypothetical protein
MLFAAGRAIQYGLSPFDEARTKGAFRRCKPRCLLNADGCAVLARGVVKHLDLAHDAAGKEGARKIAFGVSAIRDDVLATE